MKRLKHIWVLALVSFGFVGASAQSQENAKPPAKEQVQYEKSTKLDFSDREVDGEFMNPDGRSVKGEQNLYFDSLFDERKNFRDELERSAEAIR